ncbi:MAG: hypothetical protein EI684_07030 [Candidatus Viridilinea halotolerans]|uniref:Uncharacterized protein n=1 Tax=Candidatus Viridilinea halotolerans TaxID=2491704 RepID=A0A426U3N3_9CHLR|nr:MAG: hypothetical protein EI684_07030 [Candidatus Viridilinea halotolerans]
MQFTIAPQSGSVVWCHDLAARSAAAGIPSLTLLVVLLDADVGKSTELPAFLTGLRHEVQTTGCFPCIITPNEGLAQVVATELARHLPQEPWAVSSLTQMLESQWMTHCSGQLVVDFALALYQIQ